MHIIPQSDFSISQTKEPQQLSINDPSLFPNHLQDAPTNSDMQLPPPNPVPMLHPNPFTTSDGKQIRFNTKKDINQKDLPTRLYEGSFCRRSFDGRSGYCILAYQCLHVVREYRVHGTKIDICTYRKNIPVICCSLADKHVDEQRISAKMCQVYQDAVKGVKFGTERSFSGRRCMASMPLIVGGKVTKTGEYPHMVRTNLKEILKFFLLKKYF